MSGSVLKMMSPAEMRADIVDRTGEFTGEQVAKFRLAAEFVIKTAHAVLEAPPAERPQLYQLARVEGAAIGLDVGFLPQEYEPSTERYLEGMRKVAGHAEHVTRGAVTSH